MTSKHGEQTIVIKTLPNISKIKSSLTMKFGQLIEYNMKNIFPEKSYKMWWRTSPRSFSVKLKLSISLDQQSKAYYSFTVCFYCISNWRLSKYIETKLPTTCFYLILGIFLKKRSGTSLPAPFSAQFLKKNISYYILLTDQVSMSGYFYFVRYYAVCVLQSFVNQVVTS